MSASNSTTLTVPSLSIGNNLVEISALFTLIGSPAAESPVLGSQGAAGLAWAATSFLGIISVIRGCISGACSSWLREILGIRTKTSDAAVGMDVEFGRESTHRVRGTIDAPLGIICRSDPIGANTAAVKANKTPRQSWSSVRAFDQTLSTMLSGVPGTTQGNALGVFTYAEYPFFRRHNARFQISALVLSLAKFAEVYVLWTYSPGLLGLVTALPWAYFLTVAMSVETHEFLLTRQPEILAGGLHILAGQLPTIDQPGGVRKVILGAARNPKWSLWWRMVWALGAVVCAASVFFTYFLLGQEARETVFVWAGFQVLWLATRLFVYYSSDSIDPMARRMLTERPFADLHIHLKERVLDLMLALAKHQTRVHPRGEPAYHEESFSSHKLMTMLANASPALYYPLPSTQAALSSMQVNITAVVGDTTLSSAAWMAGSDLTPMDLYDSCIVILAVPSSSATTREPRTIAVPAVRVLSGPVMITQAFDPEKRVPQFVPKGSSNLGCDLVWWYWIPCAEAGMWLQVGSSAMGILGKREAEVLADADVTGRLAAGTLNISLTHVDAIRETIEITRRASESLLEFVT